MLGLRPKFGGLLLVAGLFLGSGCAADANGGLAFTALVIPDHGAMHGNVKDVSILMELKVENQSDAPILIDKFETPVPLFEAASSPKDKFAPSSFSLDTYKAHTSGDLHVIQPHGTTYIPVEGGLFVNPAGEFYLIASAQNGGSWKIGPLTKTNYKVFLQYKAQNLKRYSNKMVDGSVMSPWEGDVHSSAASFQIR
jgi:hypothetical protein